MITRRTEPPEIKRTRDPRWLACFNMDEPGEPPCTSSFQVVVRARNVKRAIDACRQRLRELRTTTSLFDDPCSIYFECIIAIETVDSSAAS